MKIRLTVTFDQQAPTNAGEKFELTCTARDILAWEKAGPGRAAAQVINLAGFRLDDLYSLSFATMRRQGLWGGKETELREWAEVDLGHASVSKEDEEREAEEPDPEDLPTPSGHSSGG
jgi:hypothetical protein